MNTTEITKQELLDDLFTYTRGIFVQFIIDKLKYKIKKCNKSNTEFDVTGDTLFPLDTTDLLADNGFTNIYVEKNTDWNVIIHANYKDNFTIKVHTHSSKWYDWKTEDYMNGGSETKGFGTLEIELSDSLIKTFNLI